MKKMTRNSKMAIMPFYLGLIALFLSSSLFASTWKVEFLKGKAATYANKKKTFIKKGDEVKEGVAIMTANSSLVKLKSDKGVQVIVGPSSQLALPVKKEDQPSVLYLVKGKLRYLGGIGAKEKGTPSVRTKTASLAIRGTDFMLVSTPFLGESEIVLFEGDVRFGNISDKKDFQDLKPGQWGGLGGRFGPSVKKPLDLPESVLNVFKSQFSLE